MGWALRAAAILLALQGIGVGIPAILGIRSLAAGKGIAYVMGYPSYGGGPFERIGIPSTVPLLSIFLLVCIAEVVAGILVWRGSRVGAILSLALLVPGIVFWIGFALPFPPMLSLARTILIVMSWAELT